MVFSTLAQCLLLLVLANGAPILARNLCGARFSAPLDGGVRWFDGSPLLGSSKTLRGVIAACLLCALVAIPLQLGLLQGALFGLAAMVGDLLSSFCKRRFGIQASGSAPLLDQIPETLLPLLVFRSHFQLSLLDIALLVVLFIVIERQLSPLLYRIGIRKRPW